MSREPIAVALLACIHLAPAAAAAQSPPAMDTAALRAHTWFLAHDLLEGRRTGSRGGELAAAYLAAAAERLGLRGAVNGSFYQDVPLVEAALDTARTTLALSVSGPAGTRRTVFRTGAGFIPNAGTSRSLVPFGGELAFVGSASDILSAPERLPPLEGRVAVMLGVFGRDRAAADTLRSRGSTGVLQLVADPGMYRQYVTARGPARVYSAHEWVSNSFVPDLPAVLVHRDLARRLVPLPAPGDEPVRPFVATGRAVQVTIVMTARPIRARNVAALLEGAGPTLRGEYVVYTAHHDHLGYSTPDASGDSLYNGFSDDAAGSAMLLAIAEAFAARRPQRSVLFLWFTGEELGLLGSDFWVAEPPVPLERMAGVINLDAGAPPAPVVTWHVQGGVESTLGEVAAAVARRSGWETRLQPASATSDHYPFLRAGVPAVSLVPAPAPYEGLTTDSSEALRRTWDRYHLPADEWRQGFPLEGLVRYARFGWLLGDAIATGRRPVMTGR